MIRKNTKLKEYKKIRKIGIELHAKMLQELSTTDIKIAARALGMFKKNTMIFDSEYDIDRCYDFIINDYKNASGKSLVETYIKKGKVISDDEKRILEANLSSRSSLYDVVGVNHADNTVELYDLINGGNNIHLLDIGFSSSSTIKNFLIYTRIIKFKEFNMTSGAPLLFDKNHRDLLLKKYNQKMKKVLIGDEQTKLAAAFFHLYQRYGYHEMEYA